MATTNIGNDRMATTKRLAQDNEEIKERNARNMAWFLFLVVAVAIIGGAYYYATANQRAAEESQPYLTERTPQPAMRDSATPTTGTDTVARPSVAP